LYLWQNVGVIKPKRVRSDAHVAHEHNTSVRKPTLKTELLHFAAVGRMMLELMLNV
jgi:hypothetical protein